MAGLRLTAGDQRTEAYSSSGEHLRDELRRLGLLIQTRLGGGDSGSADPSGVRGAILGDTELAGLLTWTGEGTAERLRMSEIADPSPDGLDRYEKRIRARVDATTRNGVDLPLPRLSRLFSLSPFEERCLILCLAPELDRRYGKFYAVLQDDIAQTRPTVGLAMELFSSSLEDRVAAKETLRPQSSLRKLRLLRTEQPLGRGTASLVCQDLVLEDKVIDYLLGFDRMDPVLEPFARVVTPSEVDSHTAVPELVCEKVKTLIRSHFQDGREDQRGLAFFLSGPLGAGKRSLVRRLCCDLELPMIVADVKAMAHGQASFDDLAWRLGRETALSGALLCLDNIDPLEATSDPHQDRSRAILCEVMETCSPLTFLLGRHPCQQEQWASEVLRLHVDLPVPDVRARRDLWASALAEGTALETNKLDLDGLAGKFRFTPGQIRRVIASAKDLAHWRHEEEGRIDDGDLYAAARAQYVGELGTLARKLPLLSTWDDLVLPFEQSTHLREICDQARCRHIVYEDWGFDRKLALGQGLNVLFSGPPGTGKTLGATVIARELELDLYRIDLSRVVSKYIGETEKNLDRVFTEAQSGNAILLFDEADALFGRRSEVRDAHDRYANIEIGYLLQKMEEYGGIAVLATNLRSNMDEAFVRRMHAIVDFPFPDESLRKALWMKAFPPQMPVDGTIDFDFLAYKFKLSGGNIRNVTLHAAFLAAGENLNVGMRHILRSLRREYQKMGGGLPHDVP